MLEQTQTEPRGCRTERGGLLLFGQEGRKRSAEKRRLLIDHLATWHFSNRPLLLRAMKLQKEECGYFKSLCNEGLISEHNYPTHAGPIALLAVGGYAIASEKHHHMYRYNKRPTSVSASSLRHDLACQAAILDTPNVRADSVTPAWLIGIKGGTKTPDVVYKRTDGKTVAVEIQLSAKARKHCFVAFRYYIQAMLPYKGPDGKTIDEKKYDHVRFIFREPSIMAYEKELFDRPLWPRYTYNPETRIYVLEEDNPIVTASLPLAKIFSFELASLRID